MVDMLCSEPCVWGVLCAGLINSLRGFWVWRMGIAGGERRAKEGVQGLGSMRSELGVGGLGPGSMIWDKDG